MDVSRQNLPADPKLLAQMNAALEWWRDAGVDYAFDDAPRPWIVAADQPPAPADLDRFPTATALPTTAPPPPALIGGDKARWPTELSAFAEWWLNEPSLDSGQVRGRVAPRGAIAAPLMILVPEPEAQDSDSLLSGPQGSLLAAMLAAMGLRESQVYIASALPRHMPMADWRDLAAQGLAEVVQLHVALARPQRVIAFGRYFTALLRPPEFESPLPSNGPPQTMPVFLTISHGHTVPLLVARDLGSLLERPVAKGHLWQRWLEWTAG